MILLIETSTRNCSVALGRDDGTVVALKEESSGQYLHAERLHVMIDALLEEQQVGRSALQAVAVGRGPGSFTGLRIGVSTAKGICTGLGIPLLAPCPLKGLRHRGSEVLQVFSDMPQRIVPGIDARRMELFTLDGADRPVAAVVDADFRPDLGPGPALLVSDDAEKCRAILDGHPADWTLLQCHPSAADLLPEAIRLHKAGRFEDVADFEPFYLKDFIPGKPKDPLGLRTPTT